MKAKSKGVNIKFILTIATPIVVTFLLSIFLQNSIVGNPELTQRWLESFGHLAILIYILVSTVAVIVAPIGGFGASIAILAIYGPFWGSILIYLVATPLYVANFLIARKFGRPVVRKLVGTEGVERIDKYSDKLKPEILVLLKIGVGANFDWVSYAAGFTKISVKTFLLVNFLGGIPGTIILFLIMKFAPSFSTGILILYLVPVVLGATYLPFHKKFKKYLSTKSLLERDI